MSDMQITATIRCDGCGAKIEKDLDCGYKPPAGWSLYDCAADEMLAGLTSVQAGKMLCRKCTAIIDEAVPEDRDTTEAEIEAALAKALP